jgi:acyl carrier protein phosphodiesterase
MNFLAHLYLSFGDEQITIGNFIADHIKGKSGAMLPPKIKLGINLHRAIDDFTDHHEVVYRTKLRLRPEFRKYAPVIADVYYDHFLAADWNNYSTIPLHQFAISFYQMAHRYHNILPARTQRMLPVMIKHDWLTSYKSVEGIHAVLTGMSHRTTFESGMERAAAELEKNYASYKKEFRDFFPELIHFSKTWIAEMQPPLNG